jgi:drug/metabolite transporter (DMT)-like permease
MGSSLAIAAAVAFAVGTVLQQKGALSTEAPENDPHFLLQVLHKPVWLAGGICQAFGWILQAMALDRASLVTVQSLTALSLVIALPLGVWLTGQHVGSRETAGALLTLAGIILFLSAGQPQGGTSQPNASTWWTACLVTLVVVVTLAAVGNRMMGAAKAVTFGTAAGLGFGLQAAVTKTFVTELGGGLLGVLGSWTVYVLIASAISGFILQQSALKTGVLAPAMASSNSVTLFASVILGVTVYGETLSKSGTGHAASASVGLAVAVGGIILLAGAEAPKPAGEPQQPAETERDRSGNRP